MLLIAAMMAASVAALPAPADSNRQDGDRMVCRNLTYTGTRLGSNKICKTKAEWNELQAEHDRMLREQQALNRTLKSN